MKWECSSVFWLSLITKYMEEEIRQEHIAFAKLKEQQKIV